MPQNGMLNYRENIFLDIFSLESYLISYREICFRFDKYFFEENFYSVFSNIIKFSFYILLKQGEEKKITKNNS